MADYPVLDGAGNVIIQYEKDPNLVDAPHDHSNDYPVRDGSGDTVVVGGPIPHDPCRDYPVLDANDDTIIAEPYEGHECPSLGSGGAFDSGYSNGFET